MVSLLKDRPDNRSRVATRLMNLYVQNFSFPLKFSLFVLSDCANRVTSDLVGEKTVLLYLFRHKRLLVEGLYHFLNHILAKSPPFLLS